MARTYRDPANHGLAHSPLKAIVAPRPIGWISTYDDEGTANLAPYSFFNLVSDRPPLLMFSSVGWKDSATHAVARGAFAVNLATFVLRDEVNATSAPLPRGESEFAATGLTAVRCRDVDAPMVDEAPVVLECAVTQEFSPLSRGGGKADAVVVFGEVVGMHIDDSLIVDGRFDTASAQPLSRLGYFDYARVDRVFELPRPGSAKKAT